MTPVSTREMGLTDLEAVYVRPDDVRLQIIESFCHDLRQPLNAALLRTSSLIDRISDPTSSEIVREVLLSLREMYSTSETVFDAIRLSRSAIAVQNTSTFLPRLFRQLNLVFEKQARLKGLTLRFRASRLIAEVDEWMLTRVLENLISNAIKFTESGSVLVTCRRATAVLRCEVRDTGPGLEQASLATTSPSFVPLGLHMREDQARSGLGLSNCLEFSKLLGGQLLFCSLAGRGTCFRLDVPCRLEERASGPETAVTESKQRSVMVLCDDQGVSRRTERLFIAGGWTSSTFVDPLRFLATVSVLGLRPSATVIPDRIGAVTAEFLLRILQSRYEDLLVVVVFQSALDPSITRIREWGAHVVVGELSAKDIEEVAARLSQLGRENRRDTVRAD